MVAGGDPTPAPMYCRVQIWDGTSWSYVNRLSVGRRYQGMFGTTNDAVVAGGHSWQPHLPDSNKNYPNSPSEIGLLKYGMEILGVKLVTY